MDSEDSFLMPNTYMTQGQKSLAEAQVVLIQKEIQIFEICHREIGDMSGGRKKRLAARMTKRTGGTLDSRNRSRARPEVVSER